MRVRKELAPMEVYKPILHIFNATFALVTKLTASEQRQD